MRELTLFGHDDLRWVDRPDPVLVQETDAVVRPIVVSRCDGDVLPIHYRGVPRAFQAGLLTGAIDPAVGHICGPVPFRGPFAIGHEAVAEVLEVGSEVTGVRPGQLVVVPWSVSCGHCDTCRRGLTSKCRTARSGPDGERTLAAYGFGPASGPYGGMVADLVRVPFADGMLVPLPAGLDPLRVAAASDNLSDAWRCVVPHLRERPGARVLVLGGGAQSIGLYAAGLAVAHGAAGVTYLDESTRRREVAASFGAETGHRARRSARPPAGSEPYDIVVEASSSPAGVRYGVRATAPGGVCTAVGYYVTATTGVPLMHMYATDVTLRLGISHPRAALPELLAWVHDHDFPAERVTSRLADFDDAPSAYGAHTTKVVLRRDRVSTPPR